MAHLATPGNRVQPLISASVEPKAKGLDMFGWGFHGVWMGLGTSSFVLSLGCFDRQPLVSVDLHRCERVGGQRTDRD